MGQSTNAIYCWGIATEIEHYNYDAADEVNNLTTRMPAVQVFRHCSGDCPMIGFGMLRKAAKRGYPQKLEPQEVPEAAAQRVLGCIQSYVARAETSEEGLHEDTKEQLLAIKAEDLGWYICSDWS